MVSKIVKTSFKIFKRRLNAFTLIETVVAVVIISITLSAIALIGFNIYRSVPGAAKTKDEYAIKKTVDSLMQTNWKQGRSLKIDKVSYSYSKRSSKIFDSLSVVTIKVLDTLENEYTFNKYVKKQLQ